MWFKCESHEKMLAISVREFDSVIPADKVDRINSWLRDGAHA